MTYFKIDMKVFSVLPEVCFGAVIAKGVDNAGNRPEITAILDTETKAMCKRLDGVNLKDYPAIACYRDAFIRLGINPNKYPCSIEALCKRVMKGAKGAALNGAMLNGAALNGAALPSINPIVDIGNAMSLKYILPMGAHDIGKLCGDLDVRFAVDGDSFVPFGESASEKPEEGELVYASGNTVKTRRWIWRQSEDGKIDASSSNIIFPIDGFTGNREAVIAAQSELSELLRTHFGCDVKTGFLNRENPSIEIYE